MKKIFGLFVALVAAFSIVGCARDADVASRNLSAKADSFEITRRVVFYNGITGEYMLTVQGLCSLGNNDSHRQLSLTCKVGEGTYKKHFLGLSDNVTYFVEQIEPSKVSKFHYNVVFKPQSVIPDITFKGSAEELMTTEVK